MQKVLIIISLVAILGCSTSRLQKKGYKAEVSHIMRESSLGDTITTREPLRFYSLDGRQAYIIPVTKDSGQDIMSLDIDEVVVTTKSRSLPERNGLVLVELDIRIPRHIRNSCRMLELYPVLHGHPSDSILDRFRFRGKLYEQINQRSFWQLEKYNRRHRQDSIKLRRFRDCLLCQPDSEALIDEVVTDSGDITLRYSKEINTRGKGSRIHITLPGSLTDPAGRCVSLPCSDTISFVISSLVSLADTVNIPHVIYPDGTFGPDTLYIRGMRSLLDRRYFDSARELEPYNDINTAIAYLSTGRDTMALNSLKTALNGAKTEYLKALTYSRLGDLKTAKECFDNAIILDGNLRYRANLDPEMYFLNQLEYETEN